jgi:hypothetical protein
MPTPTLFAVLFWVSISVSGIVSVLGDLARIIKRENAPLKGGALGVNVAGSRTLRKRAGQSVLCNKALRLLSTFFVTQLVRNAGRKVTTFWRFPRLDM